MADTTTRKLSQDAVDYRTGRGGMMAPKQYCNLCSYYQRGTPASCTIVQGPIRPNGVCNRFDFGDNPYV